MDEVPEEVVVALREVRDSGATNMFARNVVIHLVRELNFEAALWLENNKSRYFEALELM